MGDEHNTHEDAADILVERMRRAGGIARSADLDIISQIIRTELRDRDAALLDARAEIARLQTAVGELESGYQNSMELSLTYQGRLERANNEIVRIRAAERASIVAMISRFEAERMEGKQLEEADGDPLEAEVFWNQVIAARMIRKSIERGDHARSEPA